MDQYFRHNSLIPFFIKSFKAQYIIEIFLKAGASLAITGKYHLL